MAAVSSRTKRTVREFFRAPIEDSLPWETIAAAVAKSTDLALVSEPELLEFVSPSDQLETLPVGEGGAA